MCVCVYTYMYTYILIYRHLLLCLIYTQQIYKVYTFIIVSLLTEKEPEAQRG